ncbi:MAG: NADH:ubiquinone oxidoreductase subunit N, partial [Gammaproteobacteria bacterium]|nr:NADH:ubiquinone oxidoreductase subunit N [Gammaproteobacteria bacterium]
MTPFIQPNLLPALPEMVMLGMACLVLIVDLFLPQEKRGFTLLLSLLTLVLVGFATVYVAPASSISTFGGSFILDKLAVTLKLSVYVVTFMVFVYSRDYLKDLNIYKGEYYVLGLFAVLGMMIMISAHSFLLIYLGLELLSLSLYAMIASNRDSVIASEAAMKYFVLGALASGLLLYGISMFYGLSGTLDITELSSIIKTQAEANPVMLA